MAGYCGCSKSNNAIRAEHEGKYPKSKWNKKLFQQVLEEINGLDSDVVRGIISQYTLNNLKNLLLFSEWHHCSKFYNITEYYEIDPELNDEYKIVDFLNYDNKIEYTVEQLEEIGKNIRIKQQEELEKKQQEIKANENFKNLRNKRLFISNINYLLKEFTGDKEQLSKYQIIDNSIVRISRSSEQFDISTKTSHEWTLIYYNNKLYVTTNSGTHFMTYFKNSTNNFIVPEELVNRNYSISRADRRDHKDIERIQYFLENIKKFKSIN